MRRQSHLGLARWRGMRAAQAELAVNQAQDLPQVTLDGSEQRTLFSKNYIIPPPYGGCYRWYGSLTANLSWNLDFWGKQAALIERARNTARGRGAGCRSRPAGAVGRLRPGLYQSGAQLSVWRYRRRHRGRAHRDPEDQPRPLRQRAWKMASAVEQAKSLLSIAKADQAAARRRARWTCMPSRRWPGRAPAPMHDHRPPQCQSGCDACRCRRSFPRISWRAVPISWPPRRASKPRCKGRTRRHAAFIPDINLAALGGLSGHRSCRACCAGDFFHHGHRPAIHLPIFDAGKSEGHDARATADLD